MKYIKEKEYVFKKDSETVISAERIPAFFQNKWQPAHLLLSHQNQDSALKKFEFHVNVNSRKLG